MQIAVLELGFICRAVFCLSLKKFIVIAHALFLEVQINF